MLIPGNEEKEKVMIIINEFTSITSPTMIDAILERLCVGHSIDYITKTSGIKQSNLSRDLDKLNIKSDAIDKVKELDWARFRLDQKSDINKSNIEAG